MKSLSHVGTNWRQLKERSTEAWLMSESRLDLIWVNHNLIQNNAEQWTKDTELRRSNGGHCPALSLSLYRPSIGLGRPSKASHINTVRFSYRSAFPKMKNGLIVTYRRQRQWSLLPWKWHWCPFKMEVPCNGGGYVNCPVAKAFWPRL